MKGGALKGMKVLLVEDVEINRAIAKRIICGNGGRVVTAYNGREAVSFFLDSAPGEFAAILMDLRMPVMDGFAAACQIRASGREDAGVIPIIAVTSEADELNVRRCYDCGMNYHLAKPYEAGSLVGAILKFAKKF